VALAKAAGAIIVGKTATTELAGSHPTKTRNPQNPEYTPGGSSSGSAAAVSSGMVPMAFGTQTAGSVIRPAAYCGVVGFKPTFGLVPRGGVKLQSETLDTIGVFTRTVAQFPGLVAARRRPGRHGRAPQEAVLGPDVDLDRGPATGVQDLAGVNSGYSRHRTRSSVAGRTVGVLQG
jgi:amidase